MAMLAMVLFPLGVRLSTWLTVGAFAVIAVRRRDREPLLAAAAWIMGFEAVFQIASIALDRLPLGLPGPLFFVAVGVVTVMLAQRAGVRPDRRLIAVALLLMLVWVATGFHLNGHQHGMFSLHTRIADFDPLAELLNEASKTLWALAYLLPLWRRSGELVPGAKLERPAWDAAATDLRA